MKFLQKRSKTTEEEQPKMEKKRKLNAKEEMSIYFAPKKSVLLSERDPNVPSKVHACSDHSKVMVSNRTGATVELPEKPFGSSGPHPQPRPRSRSTSYFTWSQSTRQPIESGLADNKISRKRANTNAHGPSKPRPVSPVDVTTQTYEKQTKDHKRNLGYPKVHKIRHDEQQKSSGPKMHRANSQSTQIHYCEHDIQCEFEEQTTDHRLNLQEDHARGTERDTTITESPKQTDNKQMGRDDLEAKFQQHENQREISHLSKLLQQCETATLGARRIPIRGCFGIGTEEAAEKLAQHTTSQKSVKFQWPAQRPDIYPELRYFNNLKSEKEDPSEKPTATLHPNGGKSCLDLDLEFLQSEECLSYIGEDEASSIHTEFFALGAVDTVHQEQDDTALPTVSDDWYENFLGAYQVPADFWRPNKLY